MRQLKITKQVTNRETASLDKYLQEIGRVDLITTAYILGFKWAQELKDIKRHTVFRYIFLFLV